MYLLDVIFVSQEFAGKEKCGGWGLGVLCGWFQFGSVVKGEWRESVDSIGAES